jgi:hypothetical protein
MKKKRVGRPKRDRRLAIKCYLEYKKGLKSAQIGFSNGWRVESEGGRSRSRTAEIYVRLGRKYLKESTEKAFAPIDPTPPSKTRRKRHVKRKHLPFPKLI